MNEGRGTIDCRGLACPEPVLRVKGALDAAGEGVLTVLVDSAASRENVKRFAESRGAAVREEEEGSGWRLLIAHGYPCAAPGPAAAPPPPEGTALLVTSDRLGPEPELGRLLMKALLGTLGKATERPRRLLFLNRGVHLTTEGSEVLDLLGELEGLGVEILSCGTCLEFFGLRDRLRAGRVSNMYETVEALTGRLRVVTLG